MRWSRRPSDSSPDVGERAVEASAPEVEVRHVAGLGGVFARLEGGRRVRILDLGPAVGRNLELYSRVASSVCIADLLADAVGEGGSALRSPVLLKGLAERVIPALDPPFSVVLAWEVPSFLDRAETETLVRRLAIVSAPGAVLHAMVATGGEVPVRPSRWVLEGPDQVRCEPLVDDCMSAPDLAPAEIERRLAPFRVERSVVLRHGIREYVAVLGR